MPSLDGFAPNSWDDLFNFLDPRRAERSGPDRDREAEARCEEIRCRLVTFFAARRCANPDDLAIETILRVAVRCRHVEVAPSTDRFGYFYGVARNVAHESHRSLVRDSRMHDSFKHEVMRQAANGPADWSEHEAVEACLGTCMGNLPVQTRQLIVRYHATEGASKAAARQALADEVGKSLNALRIEVHRLKRSLRLCVEACLGTRPPGGALSAATAG